MRAHRLAASRGLRWVAEAFLVFRVAPLRQLLLNLAFLFAVTVLVAVPVIGFAAIWVLFPALAVGPHAIARIASRGTTPPPELLLSGFRQNLPAQLRLGGFFLAAMLLVLLATALADDGRFAQAMIGRTRLDIDDLQDPGLQLAMLVGAGLQTLLIGALWYAPLLVAWDGVSAAKAAFFSAAAALINWRAFIVYGIAMTMLFGFVLLLALGGALLFGGQRRGTGQLRAVRGGVDAAAGLVREFLPELSRCFGGENTAENPPKSPTIPS